ncbi:MAG TPA: hypothetical protein VI172_00810 [Candidatus Dormibacteraeota bacterium]
MKLSGSHLYALAFDFEFWTADGYLWTHRGTPVPCEDALVWYEDERAAREWIDLGGEG